MTKIVREIDLDFGVLGYVPCELTFNVKYDGRHSEAVLVCARALINEQFVSITKELTRKEIDQLERNFLDQYCSGVPDGDEAYELCRDAANERGNK